MLCSRVPTLPPSPFIVTFVWLWVCLVCFVGRSVNCSHPCWGNSLCAREAWTADVIAPLDASIRFVEGQKRNFLAKFSQTFMFHFSIIHSFLLNDEEEKNCCQRVELHFSQSNSYQGEDSMTVQNLQRSIATVFIVVILVFLRQSCHEAFISNHLNLHMG